jgi:hypothetical protein
LGKDNIPRYKFETSPIPEPPPFRCNRYSTPVLNIDVRPIAFEIRRRNLLLQNDQGDYSIDFDILQCLESPLLRDMDQSYKDKIRSLLPPQREVLRKAIINHNEWVTGDLLFPLTGIILMIMLMMTMKDFVPASMACLSCNTAGNSNEEN